MCIAGFLPNTLALEMLLWWWNGDFGKEKRNGSACKSTTMVWDQLVEEYRMMQPELRTMIGKKLPCTQDTDNAETDARVFAEAGVGKGPRDCNQVLLVSVAKYISKVRRAQVDVLVQLVLRALLKSLDTVLAYAYPASRSQYVHGAPPWNRADELA